MLAIGHIIAEQKAKDSEKETPQQVVGSLDSLRPVIENKYRELFTYISKLEAEIQVQESLLDGRRRSKQQDIANDRSTSRNTKNNIHKSSEVGQGTEVVSNANTVSSNTNDTNMVSSTTSNTTSMAAPQAAKPLASMMVNPSDISNAVNSNQMTAPIMTRIPNIDSSIAAQTGPMQPVMMNNHTRGSTNSTSNAQQQSINNSTQGGSFVDNQNKWQQAYRNQVSSQARKSQAPVQNQMNAKIDLPTRENEELDRQQYDVDYNESLNSIDSEQIISEPIDFSADADDEQDKINSQTFTENELSIGDVDLSKLRKRVVVANEVVLRNKKIVHAMYYLDKISDSYTKDLVDAKMSETDLVFLTTANRQFVGDENHWLLSMPERLKPIIDRNYINKIANEIGINLHREISIDVQFVDENAIQSCPTIEVHKYYENLKAQKYKEFIDDQRYSNLLSELNIDVNKGQFDMLGDIK